jgi:hypothetical protein
MAPKGQLSVVKLLLNWGSEINAADED